jgi:hypothetical protein
VRSGPSGVGGVWVLPVAELMSLADRASERDLTPDECRHYVDPAGCPAPVSLDGTAYLDGTDAYAAALASDQAEVVVGFGGTTEYSGLQRNLEDVGAKYGFRVRLQDLSLLSPPLEATTRELGAVDIVLGPAAQIAAASRPLLDVRPFIDEAQLVADYGSYLVSLSRVGGDGTSPSATGPIRGVVVEADFKAVFWTKEPEYSDLGYSAPSDWSSLMATAETMVADGRTPFCLGLGSGIGSGWPATDWVEIAVLRTAGPAFYDAWVRHEVPFDDPVVVAAIRTVGQMVHGPGFLDVEPQEAAFRSWADAAADFAGQPGTCLMTPFSGILPLFAPGEGAPPGLFQFPAFGSGFDDAVVGSVGFAAAVVDRPEVRLLLAAMASPDWGIGASEDDWPPMPANARFDVTNMTNPAAAEVAAGIQAAVRSDNFRFDASDNMPPEVQTGFNQGMMRLFREGSPDNLDELSADIAHDIEVKWLELDRTAGHG